MLRFVLFCALAAIHVQSARILGIVGTPSYSHQVVFQPIWRELSLRGHQVTVITTHPLEDPKLTNLTEISMKFINPFLEQKYKFTEILNELKDDSMKFAKFFMKTMSVAHEEQLAHPDVQKLIKDPNSEFDLVMAEFLIPTTLAFGHRFKCPIIAMTSMDASLVGHDSMGNPTHPVLNPDIVMKFTGNLTFFQRVWSTVYSVLRRVMFLYVVETEDQVVARHFGEGYPSLKEIMENDVDMFFMNVNLAFHNVRPTVPGVVHIGGAIHVQQEKPLPKDIKKFLDNSKNGAIYFSLGTNVRTKYLPKQFVDVVLAAMAELPYNFLWKSDGEEIQGKPDNVVVMNWLPQHDVLRHPNVKVFMSQCGLQSLDEAIHFAKPIVGIPFLGDQFGNSLQVQNKGFGVPIDRHTIDKDTLKKIIVEVAENPRYKEKAEELSKLVKDQPMSGLEKAIWWTEYVLRHKGAKHLRSPALDLPLYQYFLLDVIAFLILTLYILWRTTKFILGQLCRRLCALMNGGKNETKTDRNKKTK